MFPAVPGFPASFEIIERPAGQSLEPAAIELEIFGRVNPELFRFAQRFRAQDAERDDQYVRPFLLNLSDQIAGFFGAEICD